MGSSTARFLRAHIAVAFEDEDDVALFINGRPNWRNVNGRDNHGNMANKNNDDKRWNRERRSLQLAMWAAFARAP